MRIAFASLTGCPLTRLCIPRGDDFVMLAGLRQDDDVVAVDLTDSVVTASILDGVEEVATIRSYSAAEIDVDDGGVAELRFASAKTSALTPGTYGFAVRVHKQGATLDTGTGTFAASSAVVLASIDMSAVRIGDLLVPASVLNDEPAVITAVDVGTSTVTTAGRTWAAEASVPVTIRAATRSTPKGVRTIDIV